MKSPKAIALGLALTLGWIGSAGAISSRDYDAWQVRGHELHRGMTKAQVRGLLGKPTIDGGNVWRYKQKPQAIAFGKGLLTGLMAPPTPEEAGYSARDLRFVDGKLVSSKVTSLYSSFP